MPKYVNVNGIWKEENASHVNVNGVWKQKKSEYVNVNGIWKDLMTYSSIFHIGYSKNYGNRTQDPIEIMSKTSTSLKVKLYPHLSGGGGIWISFVPSVAAPSKAVQIRQNVNITPYISSNKISHLSASVGMGYTPDKAGITQGGISDIKTNLSIYSSINNFTNQTTKNLAAFRSQNVNSMGSPNMTLTIDNSEISSNWGSSDYIILEWTEATFNTTNYLTR